eukprot:scaffold833_cov352-Pavlova_lutheri.AAC.9
MVDEGTTSKWTNALKRHRHTVSVQATNQPNGQKKFKNSSTKKTKTVYVCEQCGEGHAQWLGQCPSCKTYGSLHALRLEPETDTNPKGGGAAARAVGWVRGMEAPMPLTQILQHSTEREINGDPTYVALKHASRLRLEGTMGKEVERVLGGGIMPGSLVLVAGDPGVGKSTLMLQVAGMLAEALPGMPHPAPHAKVVQASAETITPGIVLYVSGEESSGQLAGRAARLGIDSQQLYIFSATKLDDVLRVMEELKPSAAVVDSIQTLYLEGATGSAGSVSQVRECATALLHASKHTGTSTFLVGHVTKSGDIAGPRVLEHIVDVVLHVEGDKVQCHRLLRGIKNRFGPTDEVGVFEMLDKGLVAVENPSLLFLRESALSNGVSGAITINLEGSRPILMEVQALCSQVGQGQGPRRTSSGIAHGRLHLLLAILSKHAKVPTYDQDVFVNVVGGVQLSEPASDLAVAAAIASSYFDLPLLPSTAFAGEVGLGGELRGVAQIGRRVAEAAKLGFQRVIVPSASDVSLEGIEVIKCEHLRDVFQTCMGMAVE